MKQERPDRINRIVLTVLGLVLLAVGLYGVLRGAGVFGDGRARDPLLLAEARDWVSDHDGWVWPLAAALSFVVAYLGWRWLRYQVRSSPRVSDIELGADPDTGSTRLRAVGAADALADDIERSDGVQSASARLLADGRQPEVDVRVDVFDDADIDGVRQHIEERTFERFKQALQADDVRAHIQLRPGEPQGRTVE